MRHSLCWLSVLLSLSCLISDALSVAVNIPLLLHRPGLSNPERRRTEAKRPAIAKRSILDEYIEHAMPIALILPVQNAACYLDETLDTISAMAMAEWAKQTPESSMLTLSNESLSLTFASSIPVPWQFIMFLCDNLADQAQRGWTGIYRGIWIHAATQVMIFVQMRISMVAAAA